MFKNNRVKKVKKFQIIRLFIQLLYLGIVVLIAVKRPIGVVVALTLLSLVGGAWFCGWLCPFGTLQQFARVVGKRVFPKLNLNLQKHDKYLKYLRYLLLVATASGLGVFLFFGGLFKSSIGIISLNFSYILPATWIALILFLALSLFSDRLFCRYFCTEGARHGLVSLFRIFSIKRSKENCIDCSVCTRACPTSIDIEKSLVVRNGQCINCFECISACPKKGVLTYGFTFSKKGVKK